MLKILIIFLVLVGGFFLGPIFEGHQGSAVFEVAKYRISMSFNSFVILQLLGLLVLYLVYEICKKIFNSKIMNIVQLKSQLKNY